MPEPGGEGRPYYLADQLTLFEPREGRVSPLITTGTPNVFHLPASLNNSYLNHFHIFYVHKNFIAVQSPILYIEYDSYHEIEILQRMHDYDKQFLRHNIINLRIFLAGTMSSRITQPLHF